MYPVRFQPYLRFIIMKINYLLSIVVILSSNVWAYGPSSPQWRVVNDTVMGGVSSSSATPLERGVVRFAGLLSLENNGGFASIRADSSEFAFSEDGDLILQVRGDGRTYTVDLRTGERQGAFSYKQAFRTRAGEIMQIRLPLRDFQPTAFGRSMPLAGPLNPSRVMSFGFMLADKKSGPFRLDVLSVRFDPTPAPQVSGPAGLIDLAIHEGVPLFNRGDEDACAAVYRTAAQALMVMGPDALPEGVHHQLQTDMAKMTESMTANEEAWALRRALDRARAQM
jgi:monofunctional biosynthetic peptidoglycan transglycosylase